MNLLSSVPVTGDNSNIWLWVGIMLASVCAVALLLIKTKPKKDDNAQDDGDDEQ